MTVTRWSVRIHKWLALLVGLQIVLWILGGLVMSAIPIERVRGEHKIAETAPVSFTPGGVISVEAAAGAAGYATLRKASLTELLGRPVWIVEREEGDISVVDARDGAVLSPISESLAREIADADYSGPAPISAIEWLEKPPTEYGRAGPVWRVSFSDQDQTALYIDPMRAEVRARRSSTWRFYDFFWRLHVMDYDDGEDFNHPLLITTAGAAAITVLAGLSLLFVRMRRSLIVWRNTRRRRAP